MKDQELIDNANFYRDIDNPVKTVQEAKEFLKSLTNFMNYQDKELNKS